MINRPGSAAASVPDYVLQALERRQSLSREELDRVHQVHHFLSPAPGRVVHVTETFTLTSWIRSPRRGALLLPGTLVKGDWYEIDVDGYRSVSTLAKRGFFVFAVDYEGTGQSSRPANGYDVTHDFLVSESRWVLEQVRSLRKIGRVDLLGESNGGAVVAELADDAESVRSCVLSSMLYEKGTEYYSTRFCDPDFVRFLSNQPEGYLAAGPELYFNITSRMTEQVRDATLATQPGVNAMGYVTSPFSGLPWFDPKRAKVPALILQGTEDNIATQEDAELLRRAYGSTGGGRATLVRLSGAGHIPRVEPAPINTQWLDAVLGFLDSE